MQRNRTDYFSNIATPHMPRYSRDLGVHSRLQTFKHGHLIPFYSRLVYPHSNLKLDCNHFIRMDTSLRVPLDDIFMDTYFFFVPLRIIDKNFEKILGYKNTYDPNSYYFPLMDLSSSDYYPFTHDSLFQYFGYQFACREGSISGYLNPVTYTDDGETKNTGGWKSANGATLDAVNTYQLAAYYIVYNEYFRDESLDPEIPVEDLLVQGFNVDRVTLASSNSLWNNFDVLPVNRYHDIFSSGIVTPTGAQGDVYIPLGNQLVPVITGTEHTTGGLSGLKFRDASGNLPTSDGDLYIGASGLLHKGTAIAGSTTAPVYSPTNLYADLNQAHGASIQQLYLSMALYSLFDKRGTFGSRMIEQIRGSFGLEVPDGLVDRAEYLGGSCQSLNNVPVLNTADDLGEMRGNSATMTGVNSFDKGFNEWGFVIGVYCTRIKHSYSQGVTNPAWKIFDNLDLYWPEFANVGKFGTPNYRIFNNPSSGVNTGVFNYTDAFIDQETDIDSTAGDFGAMHHANLTELATKWSYQDFYSYPPTFSATWLKEPQNNVRRTLSGLIIPNSANDDFADTVNRIIGGHQFLCQTKWRSTLVLAKPPHSKVPNITGRI